jgi:hypothetical protein
MTAHFDQLLGSEAISSPKEGKRSVVGSSKNKASGRSFMGNMMDTLFMRNATLKSRGKTTEVNLDDAYQVHSVFHLALCCWD